MKIINEKAYGVIKKIDNFREIAVAFAKDKDNPIQFEIREKCLVKDILKGGRKNATNNKNQ